MNSPLSGWSGTWSCPNIGKFSRCDSQATIDAETGDRYTIDVDSEGAATGHGIPLQPPTQLYSSKTVEHSSEQPETPTQPQPAGNHCNTAAFSTSNRLGASLAQSSPSPQSPKTQTASPLAEISQGLGLGTDSDTPVPGSSRPVVKVVPGPILPKESGHGHSHGQGDRFVLAVPTTGDDDADAAVSKKGEHRGAPVQKRVVQDSRTNTTGRSSPFDCQNDTSDLRSRQDVALPATGGAITLMGAEADELQSRQLVLEEESVIWKRLHSLMLNCAEVIESNYGVLSQEIPKLLHGKSRMNMVADAAVQFDLSELSHPEWLHPAFEITKSNPLATFKRLSRRQRVWYVNSFSKTIDSCSGRKTKKVFPLEGLVSIQRSSANALETHLVLSGRPHPYTVQFKTSEARERFHQVVQVLWGKHLLWAPSLVKPGFTWSPVYIESGPEDGTGSAKCTVCINASTNAQEHVSLWSGLWDMCMQPASTGSRLFAHLCSWIPADGYDLYAVAVQNLTISNDSWLTTVSKVLGEGFYLVGHLSVQKSILSLHARLTHSTKVVMISAAEFVPPSRSTMGGCSFISGISVTYLCSPIVFICCRYQESESEHLGTLGELLGRLVLGPPDVDFLQTHHHTIVLASVHHSSSLTQDTSYDLAMKSQWNQLRSSDRLMQKLSHGCTLVGFHEPAIEFPPTSPFLQVCLCELHALMCMRCSFLINL